MAKIALAHLHIVSAEGDYLVLTPGDVVPAELEDQVTNPEAFSVHEDATDTPTTDPDAPAGEGADVPPIDEPAYDPSTEDESDKPINERSFRALQTAAKARGLTADGSTETLVARLEADNRDRANAAE